MKRKIFGTVISHTPKEQNSLWVDLKNDELRYFNGQWKPVYSSLFYKKSETYSKTEVYNKTEVDNKLADKQDKLTAGTGIAISEQNVISATGGGNTRHVLTVLETISEATSAETLAKLRYDGATPTFSDLWDLDILSTVVEYNGVKYQVQDFSVYQDPSDPDNRQISITAGYIWSNLTEAGNGIIIIIMPIYDEQDPPESSISVYHY